MGRVLFPVGQQKKWMNNIITNNNLTVDGLASICRVSTRTISDWKREKYNISDIAVSLIIKKTKAKYPHNIKTLSDYWYVIKGAKKGALKRLALYGPPGTYKGRSKGGKISQLRRRLFPYLYKNCNIRKNFYKPKKSRLLAELTGIILGDGGITDYQLKITLNKITEHEYIQFVSVLLRRVFKKRPDQYFYGGRKSKVCILCIGGIELIEYLDKIGLHKGNKVLRQVDVPLWIKEDINYSNACLKGLFDTDGCVYTHQHKTHGLVCLNLGWTVTNHSKSLVKFVYNTLIKNNFTPKIKEHSVYLYKEKEVVKYFDIIGSNNQRHLKRLDSYQKRKTNWRSTQVV